MTFLCWLEPNGGIWLLEAGNRELALTLLKISRLPPGAWETLTFT